jgi:hypothetical protein
VKSESCQVTASEGRNPAALKALAVRFCASIRPNDPLSASVASLVDLGTLTRR